MGANSTTNKSVRFVLLGTATILLLTSVLKLIGFVSSETPSVLGNDFTIGIAILEFALGCWLFEGSYPNRALLCALFFFILTTAGAGGLVYLGVSDCGCFGGFDFVLMSGLWLSVLVLIGLVYCCFSVQGPVNKFPDLFPGLALVALMSFLVLLAAGKIPTNIVAARLSNAPVVLDSKRAWVGLIQDSEVSFDVRVQNLGLKNLWIYGGSGTCGCKAIAEIPFELRPKESKTVTLKFATKVENRPRLVTGNYWFFARSDQIDRRITGSFCGVSLRE